jgi:hypothetical protein
VKIAKPSLRHQQLRDLAACLRSHAAEFEGMTTGFQTDDADVRLLGLRNHINHVLQVLEKKR